MKESTKIIINTYIQYVSTYTFVGPIYRTGGNLRNTPLQLFVVSEKSLRCIFQISLQSFHSREFKRIELDKKIIKFSATPVLDLVFSKSAARFGFTRVGTLIVATIYLQLIQNRYMFRSFTILQCSQQHCVQPVASDVEVVGYL